MQESSSRVDRVRRLITVGSLQAGYMIGALLLAVVAVTVNRIAELNADIHIIRLCIACMLVGDVIGLVRRRMYICGARRQARKSLMYGDHRVGTVGISWGFDAGLGLGTYRVTSGLWVLLFLTLFSNVGPLPLVVYGASFVVGLLGFTLWPRGSSTDTQVQQELMWLSQHRRIPQGVYIVAGVALLVLG